MTDVDDGSTVTDFLPAERERGVTIQSAAVSFHWPPLFSDKAPDSPKTASLVSHQINLIDTPGHADFTFEVLRSLRILDGAICILDGVAGVEAQTEKVWHQAAKYDISKIVYVNKLDRDGAAFGACVRQIASKLQSHPAVCQVPWWEGKDGKFCGIGDPIGLRAIRWNPGDGTNLKIYSLGEIASLDKNLHQEIVTARKALVELLTENEEQMLEMYLEANEDPLSIDGGAIIQSLRICMTQVKANIVPVFAGASFRNMGVQTLLDAVVQLLPDPSEVRDPEISLGEVEGKISDLLNGKLVGSQPPLESERRVAVKQKQNTALVKDLESCALAFKVVHDHRKGALVYIRVYSGVLKKQSVLFNTSLQLSERAPQLLKMYASESINVDTIPAGQIGVVPGLKHTRTGDTLVSYTGANPKSAPPAPLNTLQLRPIEVPSTMFSTSIEPNTLSEQKPVQAALELLTREDPSLQLYEDEESGQTLLSGMGEFHLEIAQDRLLNYYGAKAAVGKIQIAYREAIYHTSNLESYTFEREQGGKQNMATCIASIEPLDMTNPVESDSRFAYSALEEGNRVSICLRDPESSTDDTSFEPVIPGHLTVTLIVNAVKNGAFAALGRGINYGFPLRKTHVTLFFDPQKHCYGEASSPSAISSAARFATQAALDSTARQNGSAILEPIMNVTVSVDAASLGSVVNDISSTRGGHITSLDEEETSSSVEGAQQARQSLTPIDLNRIYAPRDPFESTDRSFSEEFAKSGTRQRLIQAKVPLKEMIGYLKYLRSLTAGRGTFVMSPDRFEKVVGQREKNLKRELGSLSV